MSSRQPYIGKQAPFEDSSMEYALFLLLFTVLSTKIVSLMKFNLWSAVYCCTRTNRCPVQLFHCSCVFLNRHRRMLFLVAKSLIARLASLTDVTWIAKNLADSLLITNLIRRDSSRVRQNPIMPGTLITLVTSILSPQTHYVACVWMCGCHMAPPFPSVICKLNSNQKPP